MPLPSKVAWADKSQTAGYDPSKLNASDVNELKAKLNALIDHVATLGSGVAPTPPVGELTVSNAAPSPGGSILVTVLASAAGSSVASVAVRNGATVLGNAIRQGLTNTWLYTWNNVPAGEHSLTALVTSAAGQFAASPAVPVATVATSFNASYTAVLADYQQKCSVAPPSGYQYPSGSATASTQAAADVAAKADAVSKITCPVPLPPHTLTGPSEGDLNGVTLTTDGGSYVLYYTRLSSVTNSDGKRMDLMLAGEICAAVDFPASHLTTNTAWAFTRNGQTFTGNFTDGTVTLA